MKERTHEGGRFKNQKGVFPRRLLDPPLEAVLFKAHVARCSCQFNKSTRGIVGMGEGWRLYQYNYTSVAGALNNFLVKEFSLRTFESTPKKKRGVIFKNFLNFPAASNQFQHNSRKKKSNRKFFSKSVFLSSPLGG